LIKVILIDDEISTLRLLPKAIDWGSLDLAICGTATDGEEGLRLFERCSPDIVIADIKMPRMDGLAFSRAVRERGHPVKIILLSAHAEFEFAQSAIQLRISDYLLKPLDEERLREVLIRVIGELKRERRQSGASVGREFYGPRETGAFGGVSEVGLSDLPPVDFSTLGDGLMELVDRAEPRALTENLDKLLRASFREYADPEQIFRFISDLSSQIKGAVTRSYGYDAGRAVPAIDIEELRGCASPDGLISFVLGLVGKTADNLKAILASKPSYVVIRRAEEYVDSRYSDHRLSLQQVADYVGMSKNYFSKVFHETAGMRFWDYLTRVRIDSAKKLLSSTLMSNYEISRKIGYESEYHFNRIFKKVVGSTPRRYQKR
jgi:two-component system, response regulator YesN